MSAPTEEEKKAVDYLKSNAIPTILDAAVKKLIKEEPVSEEAIHTVLANHSLEALSISARSNVAVKATPNYTRSVIDAEHLADYSTIAHNLTQWKNIGLKKSDPEPTAEDGDAEGEEEAKKRSGGIHRSATIVAYNMATAIAAEHPFLERFAKCLCTVGPACADETVMQEMIRAGMSVARLNLSHGTKEGHKESLKLIRDAAEQLSRSCAVAVDTCGAQVRLGPVKPSVEGGKTLSLKKGGSLTLSTDPKYLENPEEDIIYISWKDATKKIEEGQRVFVADGYLELSVIEVTETTLECNVATNYELNSNQNVNFPGVVIDIPVLNPRDVEDLQFAIDNEIDILFLSFVQRPSDVIQVRQWWKEHAPEGRQYVTIVSKIENQAGLLHLDEILLESDGIMVARGDLGSELPIQKLFVVQKSIISKCNVAGKPVLVSAQLLESMCENTGPTRAEANDVANAVLDGADSLLLSAETAVGNYPLESLTTLADLSLEAQRFLPRQQLFRSMIAMQPRPYPSEESIASVAVNSATELAAKAIITLTTSGSSARLVSKYFPPCPVIAVCKTKTTANALHLVRSVVPYHWDGVETEGRSERLDKAMEWGKSLKMFKEGDTVILIHGDLTRPATGIANVCRVWIVQ